MKRKQLILQTANSGIFGNTWEKNISKNKIEMLTENNGKTISQIFTK